MQYKTIEIRPREGSWNINFSGPDGVDRVKRKCVPHALGFLHYWETISDEKAFEMLKKHMIKRHKKEIALLHKSLIKLEKLKL